MDILRGLKRNSAPGKNNSMPGRILLVRARAHEQYAAGRALRAYIQYIITVFCNLEFINFLVKFNLIKGRF